MWSSDIPQQSSAPLKNVRDGTKINPMIQNAHLPSQNHGVTSIYKLRKLSSTIFPDIKTSLKYFCSSCNLPLKNSFDKCSCGGVKVGRFVIADIQSQLKEKFKGI